MKKWLAAALAAVVLLVVPATQADYLQAGVDAGRTGVTSELGPERDDVAFQVVLPGGRPGSAVPLIIEGAVYAPLAPVEIPNLTTSGVARVDLASASVEVIIETDAPPLAIASDGDMLFVLRDEGADAYTLSGADPAWTWDHDPFTMLEPDGSACASPAVTGDSLYLLCSQISFSDPLPHDPHPSGAPPLPPPGGDVEVATFAAALDTTTGEPRWIWQDHDQILGVLGIHPPRISPMNWGHFHLGGISVIGGLVFTMSQKPGGEHLGHGDVLVRAMDKTTGEERWSHTITLADQATEAAESQDTAFLEGTRDFRAFTAPTGDDDEAYYVIRELVAVTPQSGSEIWRHGLPQIEVDHVGGDAFALTGTDLYVASRGVLFKFDRADQSLTWSRPIPAGEHFDNEPLLLAGDLLYARTHLLPPGFEDWREHPELFANIFYAYDPDGGNIVWQHRIHQDVDRFNYRGDGAQFTSAIAQGVMAIQGLDGTLRVLGNTPASLQPVLDVNDNYPEVGELVTVDLSSTQPGVHGAPTEFRASWGDGTSTSWQDLPTFSHAYAREGLHEAMFSVRNDAGQSATTTVTFDVGADPPQNLNWLQSAVADPGFLIGFIGVLLAAGGGLVGIYHHRTTRGRLQKEIEAADRIYESGESDPSACTTALNERKVRAQGLVVDGKLNEAQFQVLENHINSLRRGLRVPSVEEAWDFLPHAMVRSLRMMMEDGSVTRYERDAFLERLDKTKGITKAQREKVRKRVEEWFEEDAGGERQ